MAYSSYWSYLNGSRHKQHGRESSYLSYGQRAVDWGYNQYRSWNRSAHRHKNRNRKNHGRNRGIAQKWKWKKQKEASMNKNFDNENTEGPTKEELENDKKCNNSSKKSTISRVFSCRSQYFRCQQCGEYEKISDLNVRNGSRVCIKCFEKHRCDICKRLKKLKMLR